MDASWRCGAHRCATNCDGRTVKVTGPGEDVDYSTETGGVCAIYVDVAGENDGNVTLTNYDDCFVITSTEYPVGTPYFERLGFGKWKESSLLALAGNDVLCGSGGDEYFFYGMPSGSRRLTSSYHAVPLTCPAPFPHHAHRW